MRALPIRLVLICAAALVVGAFLPAVPPPGRRLVPSKEGLRRKASQLLPKKQKGADEQPQQRRRKPWFRLSILALGRPMLGAMALALPRASVWLWR